MEKKYKFGTKWFNGEYWELTVFLGKLQLRFSVPQTAAWWGERPLYNFGKGHERYLKGKVNNG